MEISEELILSQLIKNTPYREKVMTYIKPTFFDESTNEDFFKGLSQLVLEDKVKIIDKNTLKLKIKDSEKIDLLINSEYDFPQQNLKLLVDETEKWVQNQVLKTALIKSVDLFHEKKNFIEDRLIIGTLVKEAMSYSFQRNMGLSYKNDIKRRFDFYNRIEEKVPTGYDLLDFYTYGGLQKKTLTVAAASSGLGKTLLGTNLAAMMSRSGRNGIYLTLELAEEFIARRMDSINTEISYHDIPDHEKDVQEFIERNVKADVRIREYPPSKANAYNIMAYVKELETVEKFKCDFLCVDYIQLLQPNNPRNGQNSYDKYGAVCIELREIACELNIPVITFSQVQRGAYGGEIGLANMADSIAIANTADLVIGLTQTNEEAQENFQTWKIIKNRMGRRGVEMRVYQDPNTLKFSQKLNPEETIMIQDFRDKRKNRTLINKEADTEGKKEKQEEVIEDMTNFVKGSKNNNSIYNDFN